MGHQNNVASERAVNKNAKKASVVLTTEQRISAIRKNVEGGLYVPATEVKLLLEMYDVVVASRENIITGESAKIAVIDQLVHQAAAELMPESRAHEAVAELESIPRG